MDNSSVLAESDVQGELSEQCADVGNTADNRMDTTCSAFHLRFGNTTESEVPENKLHEYADDMKLALECDINPSEIHAEQSSNIKSQLSPVVKGIISDKELNVTGRKDSVLTLASQDGDLLAVNHCGPGTVSSLCCSHSPPTVYAGDTDRNLTVDSTSESPISWQHTCKKDNVERVSLVGVPEVDIRGGNLVDGISVPRGPSFASEMDSSSESVTAAPDRQLDHTAAKTPSWTPVVNSLQTDHAIAATGIGSVPLGSLGTHCSENISRTKGPVESAPISVSAMSTDFKADSHLDFCSAMPFYGIPATLDANIYTSLCTESSLSKIALSKAVTGTFNDSSIINKTSGSVGTAVTPMHTLPGPLSLDAVAASSSFTGSTSAGERSASVYSLMSVAHQSASMSTNTGSAAVSLCDTNSCNSTSTSSTSLAVEEVSASNSSIGCGTANPEKLKESFNLKPPVTVMTAAAAPTEQEINDGLANLRPTAKFLYQMGLMMLREVVYEGLADHMDAIRQSGSAKYSKQQYESIQRSLKELHKDNKHLKLKNDKVCALEMVGGKCGFRTESMLVLENHLSEAHFNVSHRMFCARCDYSTPVAQSFKIHMAYHHGLEASIVKPLAFFPCRICFYETNSQQRLNSHTSSCAKSFKIEKNLAPDGTCCTPMDESLFIESNIMRKIATTSKHAHPVKPRGGTVPPNQMYPRLPMTVKDNGKFVHPAGVPGAVPVAPGSLILKANPPVTILTRPLQHGTIASQHQIMLTASQQQRLLPPKASIKVNGTEPHVTQIGGGKAVDTIMGCEICGGYIQGLQALKVHMQWCHNTNITHLTLPGFKCLALTCGEKFWTVQGLARHAKLFCKQRQKSTGATQCFLCMGHLMTSLIEHILQSHLTMLKAMVEQRRCMAPDCLALPTFATVDDLQLHMSSRHRLQMTGLSGLNSTKMANIKFQPFCSICKIKFNASNEFALHCATNHVHKCDLCGAQCSTMKSLDEHKSTVHALRWCLACSKPISRKKFSEHCESLHQVSLVRVSLKRLPKGDFEYYTLRPKRLKWGEDSS